jgi:hypothetical protein
MAVFTTKSCIHNITLLDLDFFRSRDFALLEHYHALKQIQNKARGKMNSLVRKLNRNRGSSQL